jgi:hypothetical protein
MNMKLHPRVTAVEPQADYTLQLTFANGEVRVFDVKPYLATGIFRELRDPSAFNSVRPFLGSIQWKNEADLCPDMLYEQSLPARQPALVAETPAKYTAKRTGRSQK